MPAPKCTEEDFLRLWSISPTVSAMAAALQTSSRAIYARRSDMIERGFDLPIRESLMTIRAGKQRIDLKIDDGSLLIGSDAHYWPDEITTAHKGFVHIAKQIKPWGIILNGDILDAATASRHPRIGWEKRPSMKEELEAVAERCSEIERAVPGAKLIRTHGNHDLRFDSSIAANSPEMEGVEGMALDYHLPLWKSAWSVMVNDHTLIKHRIKNGIHATWTATGDAHISCVTGHLHSLQVRPRSTMSPVNGGHIYGVDTGTLADPWGPQFGYMEDGPRNWRAGFAVLTFMGGTLMPPEIAMVVEEGVLYFRGERIEVGD
jgi:predicted phosphodiesterase